MELFWLDFLLKIDLYEKLYYTYTYICLKYYLNSKNDFLTFSVLRLFPLSAVNISRKLYLVWVGNKFRLPKTPKRAARGRLQLNRIKEGPFCRIWTIQWLQGPTWKWVPRPTETSVKDRMDGDKEDTLFGLDK